MVGKQSNRSHDHRFDVVLMDAQMPMMNGLEATEAIRHLPESEIAQVPIIAMTAHSMQEDRLRCLAAGMDDYLSKPIDVAGYRARRVLWQRNRMPNDGRGVTSPAHGPSDDTVARTELIGWRIGAAGRR